jgi:hypothetical protein
MRLAGLRLAFALALILGDIFARVIPPPSRTVLDRPDVANLFLELLGRGLRLRLITTPDKAFELDPALLQFAVFELVQAALFIDVWLSPVNIP